MKRHQVRRHGRPTRGLRCALAAMVFAWLAPTPVMAAAAASLEETMQPISRGPSQSVTCSACSDAERQEAHAQRIADRAAPEYPAQGEHMPAPTENGEMGQGLDFESVTSPLIDTGSVLSLPGASIGLPVVIQ